MSMLAFQIIVNIGMTMGVAPVAGVLLPHQLRRIGHVDQYGGRRHDLQCRQSISARLTSSSPCARNPGRAQVVLLKTEKSMHLFFSLGLLEIRAYGFMLAIAFLLGSGCRSSGRKASIPIRSWMFRCSSSSAPSSFQAIACSLHLEEFRGHWLIRSTRCRAMVVIGIAGLTMLGGVILSFLTVLVYLRVKTALSGFADIILPLFARRSDHPVGLFSERMLLRLPCEHGGFCVAFPTDSPAGAMYGDVPLYPTQLYQSFYGLLMFAIMLLAEKKFRYTGFQLHLFFILYGIGRFTIDFLRYYEDSMIIGSIAGKGISLNQGISLVFILLGIGLILWNHRKTTGLEGGGVRRPGQGE